LENEVLKKRKKAADGKVDGYRCFAKYCKLNLLLRARKTNQTTTQKKPATKKLTKWTRHWSKTMTRSSTSTIYLKRPRRTW